MQRILIAAALYGALALAIGAKAAASQPSETVAPSVGMSSTTAGQSITLEICQIHLTARTTSPKTDC